MNPLAATTSDAEADIQIPSPSSFNPLAGGRALMPVGPEPSPVENVAHRISARRPCRRHRRT
jgi:hypothetical protein